tara:strand:- start:6971 stop:7327 length:357 start_codon:yes stop_codon:yes gene_type:complete
MTLPINTAECLLHLFPNADPFKDFRVVLSDTVKIEFWNDALGEKPTDKQINDVSKEAEKTAEFKVIRVKRNRLLLETDWWACSDLVMSNEQQLYRKKLRDLPASNPDPEKIVFPVKPD